MGSQWSLWFGSSVLSVVELLEFVVDTIILALILFYRRLTARTHKMTDPPKTPSPSLTLKNYRYVEEATVSYQIEEKTMEAMAAKMADNGNVSHCQMYGPPSYTKSNKHEMPQLSSDVVLNGFRQQHEHCVDSGPNS